MTSIVLQLYSCEGGDDARLKYQDRARFPSELATCYLSSLTAEPPLTALSFLALSLS